MRTTLVLLTAALLFNAVAAEPRYTEAAGGYSLVPPDGWKLADFPGFKYKIIHGTPNNGFAPNVNVLGEAFPGTLEDYVASNEVTLKRVITGYQKLSSANLKSDSGAPLIRMTIQSEQNKMKLRQTFFFFDGQPGQKMVITCSTLLEDGTKFDAVFEKLAKSFRLEAAKAAPATAGGARTYHLNDGTKVETTQTIETEDSYTVKDSNGKIRTLKKSDIKKITE
ncbi:MAG TPA: hypothetical protein VEK08_04940 [Planctomycetota bacterium]|nr:hypothetical protein [Planctomycetota bacterium]